MTYVDGLYHPYKMVKIRMVYYCSPNIRWNSTPKKHNPNLDHVWHSWKKNTCFFTSRPVAVAPKTPMAADPQTYPRPPTFAPYSTARRPQRHWRWWRHGPCPRPCQGAPLAHLGNGDIDCQKKMGERWEKDGNMVIIYVDLYNDLKLIYNYRFIGYS